jgi:hypothetical protein
MLPNKAGQPPRDGVVTGVSGSLLRVRWATGEESSFVPGPGAVTVIGKARLPSRTGSRNVAAKKAPAKKARPTVKKAPVKKAPVKKGARAPKKQFKVQRPTKAAKRSSTKRSTATSKAKKR